MKFDLFSKKAKKKKIIIKQTKNERQTAWTGPI